MLVQNFNLFLFEMHKPARRAVKSSSPLAPHKSKSTATLGPMCLKPWPDFSRSNSVRHWGGDCKLDWSTFAASGGWTGLKRKQKNHCEKLKSRQSRWTVLDHLPTRHTYSSCSAITWSWQRTFLLRALLLSSHVLLGTLHLLNVKFGSKHSYNQHYSTTLNMQRPAHWLLSVILSSNQHYPA